MHAAFWGQVFERLPFQTVKYSLAGASTVPHTVPNSVRHAACLRVRCTFRDHLASITNPILLDAVPNQGHEAYLQNF